MSSELFRIVDTLSLDSDSAALSARQGKILNDKLLQLSLTSVTDGLIPLGAIIPIMGVFSGPNNTGSLTIPNGTPISGELSTNGLQLCDGKSINSGANSQFLNKYVPNLTDDIFLRGSLQGGNISISDGINDGNSNVKLGIANLPSHSHTGSTILIADTTISATHELSVSVDWSHSHPINIYDSGHSHGQHVAALPGSGGTGVREDYNRDAGGLSPFAQGVNTMVATTGIWATSDSRGSIVTPRATGTITLTQSGKPANTHSHTGTVTVVAEGGNTSFSIQPKYITVRYFMRVR